MRIRKREALKGQKKEKTPIPQRDKISLELKIRDWPWTEKQKELIDLALDKKSQIIFVKGPAGSAKTCISIYVALTLLNDKSHGEIIYVRSPVESADSHIGLLPGELDDKLSVYKTPLLDKLYDFLSKEQINYLIKEQRVIMTAPNFCRGSSWNGKIIILDENQNTTLRESITMLTRLGKYCKCFVLADTMQTDLNNGKRGGFEKLYQEFSDEESKQHGIFTFEFTNEDIVRGKLCQFIVEKASKLNQK